VGGFQDGLLGAGEASQVEGGIRRAGGEGFKAVVGWIQKGQRKDRKWREEGSKMWGLELKTRGHLKMGKIRGGRTSDMRQQGIRKGAGVIIYESFAIKIHCERIKYYFLPRMVRPLQIYVLFISICFLLQSRRVVRGLGCVEPNWETGYPISNQIMSAPSKCFPVDPVFI
jgi:hypothetical protein